jgi:hypothetical protein
MFPSTSKRLDAPVKETKDKDVLSKMGVELSSEKF